MNAPDGYDPREESAASRRVKKNFLTHGQATSRPLKNGHGAVGIYAREKDDFYPTPEALTRALLAAEQIKGRVWESACGDGAISRILEAQGCEVISTDLVDRGYGEARVDFLMEHRLRAPTIITNPPFKLWLEFAQHAHLLGAEKIILFGRLQVLEGKQRGQLYRLRPPARVWVHSGREKWSFVNFSKSTGMIAFCWVVWQRGDENCRLGWLP